MDFFFHFTASDRYQCFQFPVCQFDLRCAFVPVIPEQIQQTRFIFQIGGHISLRLRILYFRLQFRRTDSRFFQRHIRIFPYAVHRFLNIERKYVTLFPSGVRPQPGLTEQPFRLLDQLCFPDLFSAPDHLCKQLFQFRFALAFRIRLARQYRVIRKPDDSADKLSALFFRNMLLGKRRRFPLQFQRIRFFVQNFPGKLNMLSPLLRYRMVASGIPSADERLRIPAVIKRGIQRIKLLRSRFPWCGGFHDPLIQCGENVTVRFRQRLVNSLLILYDLRDCLFHSQRFFRHPLRFRQTVKLFVEQAFFFPEFVIFIVKTLFAVLTVGFGRSPLLMTEIVDHLVFDLNGIAAVLVRYHLRQFVRMIPRRLFQLGFSVSGIRLVGILHPCTRNIRSAELLALKPETRTDHKIRRSGCFRKSLKP